MATRGDGLYDNDAALDTLGDLVKFPPSGGDPAELAVGVGLVAWLCPRKLVEYGEELLARAESRSAALPPAARDALGALHRDPRAATGSGSRSAAARAVLGDASDGPRLDALVRLPAGRGQIADLAGRAGRVLDRLRGPMREVAGDLAALGVIIELAQANLWLRDPARLSAWRDKFDACERASTGDPSTWEARARVRSGFDLLD
jgi:hypothetical protein